MITNLRVLGAALILDSLLGVSEEYERQGDGSLYHIGKRPSPEWHKHGYLERILVMFICGQVMEKIIRKQRWYHPPSGRTCHDRPSEEIESMKYCTGIMVLRLAAYLLGKRGFYNRREFSEDLSECGSDGSVRRWLNRAQAESEAIEQAIRYMVIKKIEPRPFELLFPEGLSPPEFLVSKRWKNLKSITALWCAYTMLLVTARELGEPVSVLLAEARRKCQTRQIPFGI